MNTKKKKNTIIGSLVLVTLGVIVLYQRYVSVVPPAPVRPVPTPIAVVIPPPTPPPTPKSQTMPILHTVGQITWHPGQFIGTVVRIQGYLLQKESGYSIFSDEPTGSVSSHDLPVEGNGIDMVQPNKRYILEGIFVDHGLIASNGNPNHLVLSVVPSLAH